MSNGKTEIQQTNSITHPRYACAVGSAYTALAIPGVVPIMHCSPGCVDTQFFIMSDANGYQGSIGAGGGAIPSVNFTENDVIFGGDKKLETFIKAAIKIMKGDLFVVFAGCTAELIGDNVDEVVKKFKKYGYNVVVASTPGFKGNNLFGHEAVVEAIIDQYVGEYKGPKRKKLINVWSEVPYYNSNWRGDLVELKRILEGAGFDVNILFGPESGGIEEWKSIPKANFNLVISPWVGLKIAKHLEQKYNQPYLHIPVPPVGEEATTEFLRKVVDFAGIDKTKSEKFIEKEQKFYYYFLEGFSDYFASYWWGQPEKFAVVGDSLYSVAYSGFLADQMGLIPAKVILTDNAPKKYREGITELFHNLSEGISTEPLYLEDGYVIEDEVRKTDFGTNGTPIILGTSWERDIAKEKGASLIEVGPPTSEEVILTRSFLGYRGGLSLIEKIYSSTAGIK